MSIATVSTSRVGDWVVRGLIVGAFVSAGAWLASHRSDLAPLMLRIKGDVLYYGVIVLALYFFASLFLALSTRKRLGSAFGKAAVKTVLLCVLITAAILALLFRVVAAAFSAAPRERLLEAGATFIENLSDIVWKSQMARSH